MVSLYWACTCCWENVVFSIDVPGECDNCGSPDFENCEAVGDSWAEDE